MAKAEDAKGKASSEESPFERFERLIRGLANVPKKEIEVEEARWRVNRRSKKKNADG
jgi:hypothetical protein